MATARHILGFFGCFALPVFLFSAVSCGVSNYTVRHVFLMWLDPGLVVLLLVDASCVIAVFVVHEGGLCGDD